MWGMRRSRWPRRWHAHGVDCEHASPVSHGPFDCADSWTLQPSVLRLAAVRMLAQHRQRRQQEQAQEAARASRAHSPNHPHHSHSHGPSSFEKQQKILEDFRYACIGYSVYPTARPPAASPSTPTNPSSARGPGKPSGPSAMAEAQPIPRVPDAQPLLASVTGQGAHWQQGGAADMGVPGREERVQEGEPGTGNSAAEVAQARRPATPPPLLPACLGIEVGAPSPLAPDHSWTPQP